MCGIIGTIRGDGPIPAATFDRMLDSLWQRGPDGRGVKALENGTVVLGHRRLAIIDLSSAGAQPMCNSTGTVWLTFNGEIYNYCSLRRELVREGHRFVSQSDSEVILHAYEAWGTAMLPRLRGIFAFAIWDTKTKQLLLARDQLGVKPLYYARYGANFTFASQPKAIAEDPAFPRAMDGGALRDFLAYGYVPYDRAIFSGMAKLPAAHYAVLCNDQLQIKRYWQMSFTPEPVSAAEHVWRVRDALVDSVRAQLVADVPVGCFLSGGIDSSLLAALACTEVDELRTFTVGFKHAESDEREYGRLVAQYFRTRHFEKVMQDSHALLAMRDLPQHFDEPFDPNGALPYMEVSRLARENNTIVALGGDGADELFSGYMRYDDFDAPAPTATALGRAWRLLRESGVPVQRRLRETDVQRYFAYEGCLSDQEQSWLLADRLAPGPGDSAVASLRRWFRLDLPPVLAAQYADAHHYLVDNILCKVDRASMAFGVEARVPFLDPAVVQAAFQVPNAIQYRHGERKWLFKLIADQFLPRTVVTSRKKGFSSPLHRWHDVSFDCWARAQLTDGVLMQSDILRYDWNVGLQRIHSVDPLKAQRGLRLLLTAELWARRWLDGTSADTRTQVV